MQQWHAGLHTYNYLTSDYITSPQNAMPDPTGYSRQQQSPLDSDESDEDLEPDESGQFITGMRPMELDTITPFNLTLGLYFADLLF